MIAIVSPTNLPIPAVKGGAVETGIQQIINENEKSNNKLIIFSYYDDNAYKESLKYNNTEFLYFKPSKVEKVRNFTIKCVNAFFRKLKLKVQFNKQIGYVNFIIKNIKNRNIDKILLKNNEMFVNKIKRKLKDNVKIYLQLHNDFLNDKTFNGKKISRNCYKIITNSEYIKKRVLTIKDIKEEKIAINKNCLELTEYSFNENDVKKVIDKYDIKLDKKMILFSGRIVKQKGIKELLLALELLKDKEWNLYILGSKWFGKNQRDKFSKEIYKLKETFEKNNIITVGYVPHSEIAIWNKLADIVIVPSIWEEPARKNCS